MLLRNLYTELELPIPQDCPDIDYADLKLGYKALYYGVSQGNLKIVERLLAMPSILETLTGGEQVSQETALTHSMMLIIEAVDNCDREMVKHLLSIPEVLQASKIGADYVFGHVLRNTLYQGNLDRIKHLLAIPEVLEYAKMDNADAVYLAVQYGHLEIVKYLLTIPEMLRQVTADNRFLVKAAKCGHLEVLKHLLTLPEIVESDITDEFGALYSAISMGQLTIVEHLLTRPDVLASLRERADLLFKTAVYNDHFKVGARLLKEKSILEAMPLDNILLKEVIKKRQIKFIGLLLESSIGWYASLQCLKEEGLTVEERCILKAHLQVVLLKKLAQLGIYPKDKNFMEEAKKWISTGSEQPVPEEIVQAIAQFTSPLEKWLPLPGSVPSDLIPTILEFVGLDVPNIAYPHLAEYYLDPELEGLPILKAYQRPEKSSASSAASSPSPSAMDIDSPIDTGPNPERPKKRTRENPAVQLNTETYPSNRRIDEEEAKEERSPSLWPASDEERQSKKMRF